MKEVRRKKMQLREKGGMSTLSVFSNDFCGSGGSKSRLAEAAGAETAGQMGNDKVHAVVARSTFGSKKRQYTSVSDCFWKFRC